MTPMTRLYTTSQAGEILGVTGNTVWRWVREKRIPATDLTGGDGKPKLRISADDLQRFIENQKLEESA